MNIKIWPLIFFLLLCTYKSCFIIHRSKYHFSAFDKWKVPESVFKSTYLICFIVPLLDIHIYIWHHRSSTGENYPQVVNGYLFILLRNCCYNMYNVESPMMSTSRGWLDKHTLRWAKTRKISVIWKWLPSYTAEAQPLWCPQVVADSTGHIYWTLCLWFWKGCKGWDKFKERVNF